MTDKGKIMLNRIMNKLNDQNAFTFWVMFSMAILIFSNYLEEKNDNILKEKQIQILTHQVTELNK